MKEKVIRNPVLQRLSALLIFGIASMSQAHAGLTFNIVADWQSGLLAEVVIDNTTNESVEDWTLTFSLDEPVTQIWNGSLVSQQGSDVVIKAASYNRSIAPGTSVSVGMIVQPGNIGEVPDDLRINGLTLGRPATPQTPEVPTKYLHLKYLKYLQPLKYL